MSLRQHISHSPAADDGRLPEADPTRPEAQQVLLVFRIVQNEGCFLKQNQNLDQRGFFVFFIALFLPACWFMTILKRLQKKNHELDRKKSSRFLQVYGFRTFVTGVLKQKSGVGFNKI